MWYRRELDKIIIHVYVQPGAKHTEIAGLHGNALKIRLNVQPIEGRANEALLIYLAKLFEIPLKQVTLKRGAKSRHKAVVINRSQIDPNVFNL